jgi:hypothetical protein
MCHRSERGRRREGWQVRGVSQWKETSKRKGERARNRTAACKQEKQGQPMAGSICLAGTPLAISRSLPATLACRLPLAHSAKGREDDRVGIKGPFPPIGLNFGALAWTDRHSKSSFSSAVRFWRKEGGVCMVRERTFLICHGHFYLRRKTFVHQVRSRTLPWSAAVRPHANP